MENALRYVIVFLWCVGFGFFSVMGYLDDTMMTSPILAGLLAALVVYCAIEWSAKKKRFQPIHQTEKGHGGHALSARMSHGIRACLSVVNLPAWGSIRKRFLTTNKSSGSSKSLP